MNDTDAKQAQIKDEAAAWVVKLNAGPLSGDDAYAFEHWLHASDHHRREFKAHARVWLHAGAVTERAGDTEPFTLGGVVTAWAKVHPGRAWGGLAAACLIVLAFGFLVDLRLQPQTERLAVHTEIGQSKQVTLADGSTVQLNTNSGITTDYSRTERAVKLQKGEAHFVVAKDRSRPFRVYTGNHMIEAIGTAFRVFVGEATEVTVTEGQVRLAVLEAPTDPHVIPVPKTDAIVQAGRNAVFDADRILVEAIEKAEIDKRLSWQTGGLIFSGEPLESVVQEFARYSDRRIMLSNDIRELKVLGWFPVGDTPQFIRALEDYVDIAARTEADGSIHLYRKSPPG